MKRDLNVSPRLRALALALGLGALPLLISAAPAWYEQLNYQGQLTDSAGSPVADGSYSITFGIYDASSGGTLIWTETQNPVTVNRGLFNVILGSVNPIALGSYGTGNLYLGINVNSNGEMSPRQQLLPAVYAMNAQQLGGQPVGSAPNNIVALDATGKIPAGLVNGGSVSVPLNLSGSLSGSILSANNASSGIAVSATTNSNANAAVYGEGARYGGVFRTNDNVNGIALQAQGPGAAQVNLVDKVNNAQVYATAAGSATLPVLGVNTNASGTGIGGSGGYIGVSGTGNSYGVYGNGAAGGTGVYGTSSGYGVYGNSTSSLGVYGYSGGNYGVYGSGPSYGVYGTGYTNGGGGSFVGSGSGYGINVQGGSSSSYGAYIVNPGSYGTYSQGATYGIMATGASFGIYAYSSTYGGFFYSNGGSGRGVWARQLASTGVNYGLVADNVSTSNGAIAIQATQSAASGAVYGIKSDVSSATDGSIAVYARHTGALGRAVKAEATGSTGIGVDASGQTAVMGTANVSGGIGVYGTTADASSEGMVAEHTGTGIALSVTSGTGTAVYVRSQAYTALDAYSTGNNGATFSGNGNGIESHGRGNYSQAVLAYGDGATSSWGINASTNSTSSGRAVYGGASCATCFGGYFYNPSGVGVKGDASCATCIAGYFENTASTSGNSGNAIFAAGRIFNGAMAGTIAVAAGTLTTAAIANSYMSSTDIVMLTPLSDPGAVRYFATAVSNGSFKIGFSSVLPNATTFQYFIIGN